MKPRPPINMYGNDIKYTIPLLTPLAVEWPSSLSNTARHIAHWALASKRKNREKTISAILDFRLYIIGGYH